MRITNKMITSSYSRSLNTLNSELNKLSSQVTTGRKFAKSSEDTAAAISAYQIRKNLSKVADYQENIMRAQDFLTTTESTLTLVHESIMNALDKVNASLNSTNSSEERNILAEELSTIQDQMLQTLNSNSIGVYAFGGSNTTSKPFGIDTNGYLTYNGYTLKDLDVNDPDYAVATANAAKIEELKKDGLTMDLGLGLTVDSSGTIDPYSVFTYSIPGISVMAAGVTEVGGDEIPNNLYDQLGAIVTELRKDDGSYDRERLDALFSKLEDSSGIVLNNITEVGAKTSYLEFMTDRYGTQTLNLQERQVHVETVDTALTIINFATQKVAYQAALQMGTNIIQQSIFDFLD
jgi:flagellar hook-associated protein 3 FlgL